MTNVNWKYVLFYREIQEYLSQPESFKLGLTCKYINKKVKLKTNYLFNLKKFLKIRKYKKFEFETNNDHENYYDSKQYNNYTNPYQPITEDIEHQLGRFEFYLNMRKYPVSKLFIFNCSDNFYSYRIPNIFNNIHHLQLVDACITLELLQYLLTSLRLTSLSLDSCDFFSQKSRPSVSLPKSLVSLHLGECYFSFVKHSGGHTPESVAIENLNPNVFKFEPQNINNLKYLSFSEQSLERISNINEFLIYNPQLKSVTGLYRSLDLINLPVIHKLFRIDHLKIEENVFNTGIDNHFIEFELLKSLSIGKSVNSQHIAQLLESCPNIKKIEIGNISTYDYYTSLYPILSRTKLKNISIGLQELNSTSFYIAAPAISELEAIEFRRLPPSQFDFDTLDQLKKLVMIKFIDLDKEVLGNKQTRSALQVNENFKCIYYPTSVVYHKIHD